MDTPLTAAGSPDTTVASDFRRSFNSPSRLTQTHCLNTTVPINIVGSDIGGRHAPTKSALRHSRMIAMSRTTGKKTGTGHLSIIIKNTALGKFFVGVQFTQALVILLLAAWMWTQIPSLRIRDIPFWSGGSLFISAFFNASCLLCCRRKVSDESPSWYSFYPKLFTLTLTILAALTCLCALIFASVHVYVIRTSKCQPVDAKNATCVCEVPTTISEYDFMDLIDVHSQTYEYPSLNCWQVTTVLVLALILSATANIVGAIVSLYYVFLHKTSTFSHKYSQVPASDRSPVRL